MTLGEVTDRVSTWNPARSAPDDAITYIDLGAVDQSEKRVTAPQRITGSDAPSRARQLVIAGDVLVSTVRPNLNAVAQVSDELNGATASTGFTVLRRSSAQIDARYLFHWVKSPMFISDMVRKATGASYPAVSDRIVKDSRIPLPPIPEQRRIAAILDHADALRAKRREALARLDELTQSIFTDMFGEPDANPMGWETSVLRDLVAEGDKVNYGVVQPGPEVEGGVPLIRAGDIENGSVSLLGLRTVASEVDERHRRSRLVGDEILVSCVGSIGEVALVSIDHKGCNIARAVARIRVGESVRREYLAACLSAPSTKRYFVQELRTVAQPTLNIKQIEEAQIAVPPLDLQDEFVRRCSNLETLKSLHRTALAELDALFASLQSRAFRGEL